MVLLSEDEYQGSMPTKNRLGTIFMTHTLKPREDAKESRNSRHAYLHRTIADCIADSKSK